MITNIALSQKMRHMYFIRIRFNFKVAFFFNIVAIFEIISTILVVMCDFFMISIDRPSNS